MKPDTQFPYDSRHHPSDEQLIEYLGEQLEEAEHESVQAHLVECGDCLAAFKDVRDFFETHREGEPMISEDIAQEWIAFSNRIKDDEEAENHTPERLRSGSRFTPALGFAVAALLLVAVAIGIWVMRQRQEKQQLAKQLEVEQQQTAQLQVEQRNLADRVKELEQENLIVQERSPAVEQGRATWSTSREAALSAVSIEPTRGEVKTVDLSRGKAQVLLSLPQYDDAGRMYSRYRISLAAAEKRLWQQTLRAPSVSLTGNAHILNLVLFPRQLSQTGPYDLQVEGWVRTGWQPLGHVLLNLVER